MTERVLVGRALGGNLPDRYDEVDLARAGDMATRFVPAYDGRLHVVHVQVIDAADTEVLHLQLYVSYTGDTLTWQLECTEDAASRIRHILPAKQVKGRPTIGDLTYESQGPGGLDAPTIVALVTAALP